MSSTPDSGPEIQRIRKGDDSRPGFEIEIDKCSVGSLAAAHPYDVAATPPLDCRAIIDRMSVSLETRRRWFAQGAAAWHRAQILLGVPSTEARTDLYACPLCLEINHEERRAQFRVFIEAALTDGSLTVEHVPPESLGGRPLVLTCRACNSTAGAGLDAHARKRENPRDAFLGRVTTKISMTAGGHRLAGSFTLKDGAYLI